MSRLLRRALRLLTATAALLGVLGSTQAALVNQGNTTLDTTTGLEWLDLTLTLGQSYDSLQAGFGGYIADGWRHATGSELCALFGSQGDDVTSCAAPGQQTGPMAVATIDLIGSLFGETDSDDGSFGLYDAGLIASGFMGLGCVDPFSIGGGDCNLLGSPAWSTDTRLASPDDKIGNVGNWLVRRASTVPEPGSLAMAGLALAALAARGRRH